MEPISLGKTGLAVPQVAVGCMRICNIDKAEVPEFVSYCIENGMNFFDHADIYAGGRSESVFAEGLKDSGYKREDIILQTKCGIRKGMYDFSKEHILESVKGSLKRLNTDYIDVLLLHRPDALCEPEVVAEAFDTLYNSGMVRHFGVSNHNPYQIELLNKYFNQEIHVNQLQLSLTDARIISSGLEVNMATSGAVNTDGGVLDYCRLNDITIQAWSPYQYGMFKGVFIGNNELYPKLNETLNELSEKYGATPTAIVAAWILKHPAKIQMVSGTTKKDRMKEIYQGAEIKLERADWYKLYIDAGHILP